MEILIILLCSIVAIPVYSILKACLIPLTSRIPNGKEYKPGFHHYHR